MCPETLEVAVKKLSSDAGYESFHELFKELDLMFQVGSHLNIVNLIGNRFISCLITKLIDIT